MAKLKIKVADFDLEAKSLKEELRSKQKGLAKAKEFVLGIEDKMLELEKQKVQQSLLHDDVVTLITKYSKKVKFLSK